MRSIRLFFSAVSAEFPQSMTVIGLIGWLVFILAFILPTIIVVTTIGGV